MGSSPASAQPVSPEFLAIFQQEAGPEGFLTFARFMELALYHPTAGYYRRRHARVGTGPGTDFFTARNQDPLFGELVSAACTTLLADRPAAEYAFVEIGAEPDQGVLSGAAHSFREVRSIRLGDPLHLTGSCVVFSNELFDAQPCTRTVFRRGRWFELGVRIEGEGLVEVEIERAGCDEPATSEGYRFDRPIAAAKLAADIAAQPWHGLFVAFDYGKTLLELRDHVPGGTARAYYRHTQSNDLLARPGEQDLTCHVCWDWISTALRAGGFAEPHLEFQESFFLRHAQAVIAATSEAEARRLSRRKQALVHLLHPAHFGQRFQVMHTHRCKGF